MLLLLSAGVVCGSARTLPLAHERRRERWTRCVLPSVRDGDAHGAGGAGDDLRGGVDVVGVEVGHLRLGDLADLRLGEGADLRGVRGAGALTHARRLLDELGGRRGLGRSEEHTSELQSRGHLVCRLLLEKKNTTNNMLIVHLYESATKVCVYL